MAGDTWQSSYEAAERLHRGVLTELGERGRFPRTSIGYNQSSQRLRSQYGELSSVVQTLRETLSTSGLNLTSLELNRRRNLLENLARKCGTVREQLTELGPVSGAATRSQLLADLGTSSWAASPSPLETNKRVVPNRTGVRENNRTFGMETESLRSDQERALAEQDEGLDLLADVIRRQRGMGQDIFREVTQQNDLIDDIDDRVENVNQRLLDTTNNVRVVSKKDRTCGYWVIILLLAIAIIAVLAS